MNRPWIAVLVVVILAALVGLYLYSDIYGNPEMQKNISEIFKDTLAVVVGALANEFGRAQTP